MGYSLMRHPERPDPSQDPFVEIVPSLRVRVVGAVLESAALIAIVIGLIVMIARAA